MLCSMLGNYQNKTVLKKYFKVERWPGLAASNCNLSTQGLRQEDSLSEGVRSRLKNKQ